MLRMFSIAAAVIVIGASIASAQTKLQGGGATFPDPVYQEWVKAYSKVNPDVQVSYAAKGSGFGIAGIIDRTVDFAGSDAPMNEAEMKRATAKGGEIVEVPSVAGAVVVAYNLPDFKSELKLDGPTVANIYLGKITKWNDPAIAALNPGVALPDVKITAAHRSDGSGTNFVFTSYLCTQSPDFQQQIGFGKDVKWPGGSQGAEHNAGVTQLVKSTVGAIGYIELQYAVSNSVSFALVKNNAGKFVKASPDTVAAAGEGAIAAMDQDKSLAVGLWARDGENTYPISSFTYLIVYKDLSYFKDQAKAKAVIDYLWWATQSDDAAKIAASQNYAPLGAGVKQRVAAALATVTFDGKPIHGN